MELNLDERHIIVGKKLCNQHISPKWVRIDVFACLVPPHISDALITTPQTARHTLAYRKNSC